MLNWVRTTIQVLLTIAAAIVVYIATYVVCEILFTLFTSLFGVGLAALITLSIAMGCIVIADTFLDKDSKKKVSPARVSKDQIIQGLLQQRRQLVKTAFNHFVRSGGGVYLN